MELKFKNFYWGFGTTSFRTKNFNKKIEQQLILLREFWAKKENIDKNWEEANGIQTLYYDFLHKANFITGNAKNKPKDAREKTSGLALIGLIDDNRKLTEAGNALIKISEENNFASDNIFGIPADSFIYFRQLLKTSRKIENSIVRPFEITVYLIEKLNGLSYDEFTYILPLCIDKKTTLKSVENIKSLRNNEITINDIIFDRIMEKDNYKSALNYFLNVEFVTEKIICEIGINRKSRSYDKAYFPLYNTLHKFYVEKDNAAINEICNSLKKLTNTKILWQQYLFGKNNSSKITKSPLNYLQSTEFDLANTELKFRKTFFAVMHIIKTKRSLEDYFDLNRRYMKTSDIILFSDEKVTLDIIPRHYFASICDKLLDIAFEETPFLQKNCYLENIETFLNPNESVILRGINNEYSMNLKSLQEASELLERQRYIRLEHLINSKFTKSQILKILDLLVKREDLEIQKLVTDNADIPTIFEYILGIFWYRISNFKGKILDYMKLSLDADLLPKTHAAGGEADIVYDYESNNFYPAHSLLLEATLADKNSQRRMEMEPVSRHLGNHIIRAKNLNSYCVFVTNDLNINVVADFRGRKNLIYYDTANDNNFINGMKIIPLQIDDLKKILENNISYDKLYQIFETAFNSDLPPREWRNICIVQKLDNI